MSQTETWTIGRLLQWTQGYLKQHGVESPRLDAEILLAFARDCPRIALYTAFDDEPKESERTAFRELVKRRAQGTPVAYLVGRREFYSLPFVVTPDVLIPRPETEFLLIALLDWVKRSPPRAAPWRIADVGTGSGILAVCAAKHLPDTQVVATDISPAAIEVTRANARAHHVEAGIEFVVGDLLAGLPPDRSFDVIVSNPPYVRSDEMERLAPDVRDYEPRLALEAGPTGVEVIDRLIPAAASRLVAGGGLLMEVSPQIEPRVQDLLAQSGAFAPLATIKDLAGHARVVQAKKL